MMATDRDNDRYDRYVAPGADAEMLARQPVETIARAVRELDEEWDIPLEEREDSFSVAESILRVAREV